MIFYAMKTAIQVYEETRKMLEELNVYPRETYDDVVRRLIKAWKERTHS